MRYVLFLDDSRHPATVIPGETISRYHSDNLALIWAKDVDMAKWYCDQFGLPDFVWFDHDLGEKIDAMQWLTWLRDETEMCYIYEPFGFAIHSANPVGQKNILSFMESWIKSRQAPDDHE